MSIFNNIAPDKWRHFYAGIAMGIVLQLLVPFLFSSLLTATLVVLAIVAVISYGFELFSLITGLGHYDFIDAVASVIGGVVGMAIVLPFQL